MLFKSLPQSTNHVMMIEPVSFYANPETMETNAYQLDGHEPVEVITARAVKEYTGLRDALIEKGVRVTEGAGLPDCPDMVFPNWFFTFKDGPMILCPMLNKNRQEERSPELIELLRKHYPKVIDWTEYEEFGLALESTASIVSDRVNRIAYAALSARTDEGLVRKWCEFTGYDSVIFNTRSHTGIPVYHTDCVMWIGTTLAGVCSEAIVEEDRERVVASLRATHNVIEFSNDQLRAFCGNALEVQNKDGDKMLVMSSKALGALSDEQLQICKEYFKSIIYAPLDTLEQYGGGSARCMLAELM